MIGLAQDVRLAVRGLRRSPGFVAVALVTMAVGIGSSTAVFGVVDAVLLRPLPYPEPERLVAVLSTHPARGQSEVSFPDVEDWRTQGTAIAGLAAYRSSGAVIAGTPPEQVDAARVTPDFASVAVFLFLVALGAAARPAWRAAHVDPAAALREE